VTEFSVRAFSPWQCPPDDAPPRPVRKFGGGRDMSASARLSPDHWFRLAHEARIAAHAARVAAEVARLQWLAHKARAAVGRRRKGCA
jgi:hypothetical protein